MNSFVRKTYFLCNLISCFSGQLEMIQQSIASKFCEYSLGNCKMDLPNRDKQLTVAVKKTALRDLQNDNKIMVPTSVGKLLCFSRNM